MPLMTVPDGTAADAVSFPFRQIERRCRQMSHYANATVHKYDRYSLLFTTVPRSRRFLFTSCDVNSVVLKLMMMLVALADQIADSSPAS